MSHYPPTLAENLSKVQIGEEPSLKGGGHGHGRVWFLIWERMGLIWFHSCVCLSNVSNEVDIKNCFTSLIKCQVIIPLAM